MTSFILLLSVPLHICFVYIDYFITVLHRLREVQFVLPQSYLLNKTIVIDSKFSSHTEFSNLCWRHDWNQTGPKFRYDLVIWTVIEVKQWWYRHEFSHCTEICLGISCRQLRKSCRYFLFKRYRNVWFRGKFGSLKLSTCLYAFLFLY